MNRHFTIFWGWLALALAFIAAGALALRLAGERSCGATDSCTGRGIVDLVGAVLIALATLAGVAWSLRRAIVRPSRSGADAAVWTASERGR